MPRTAAESAKIIPPLPLPGSPGKLGIVAPASPIRRDQLDAACAALRSLGYSPFYLDSILDSDLYFAGDVSRRTRELHEMFERSDVTAILCARGGYGCNHLLPHLDLDLIRAHPKFFMGFSDVTSLLTYICDQADMVTFHGPMAISSIEQYASNAAALTGNVLAGFTHRTSQTPQPVPGTAQGILYGGCLSMLAASLATPFAVETADTILFIEDIATKPYQLDRMLMQLKLAGKFDRVRGICFGEMLDCVQPGGQDYTLLDVFRRVLSDLNIPIGFGLRSGHVSAGAAPNLCLPLGVSVSLTVTESQAAITYSPR